MIAISYRYRRDGKTFTRGGFSSLEQARAWSRQHDAVIVPSSRNTTQADRTAAIYDAATDATALLLGL